MGKGVRTSESPTATFVPTPVPRRSAIDSKFHICSHTVMIRVDDEILSLHLEVALAVAAPSLLDGLTNSDRRKRQAVTCEIARYLAERIRGLDIEGKRDRPPATWQRGLFPEDLGPIGTL